MPRIAVQRIYDGRQRPGYRVLVDRVWPRGISKQKVQFDEWCKDIAPSTDLRKWFAHDPEKWPAFRKAYVKELRSNRAAAAALLERAGKQPLVLLYGAKDEAHNNAVALKAYLQSIS